MIPDKKIQLARIPISPKLFITMAEKTAAFGNQLFEEVAALTGLPREQITEELARILQAVGSSPEKMTIEELRRAAATLLVEVMTDERGS